MRKFNCAALPLLALALAGCALTEPVAVISSNGETMKGTATAQSLGPSTFTVTNARATCTGTYDAITPSPTVSFVTKCTDGRTGVGSAVRDSDISGSGTMQMSDGTTARFVFGPGAAAF
jgi:hypothetical protein